MLNINGPNIEPCGTPNIISSKELISVVYLGSLFPLWWLRIKWTGKPNPYTLSFSRRSWGSRQLKALDKSVSKVPNVLPLSRAHSHFFKKPKDNVAYYNLPGSRIVASIKSSRKNFWQYR